jgi:TRAP-type transport system periplasmic protein
MPMTCKMIAICIAGAVSMAGGAAAAETTMTFSHFVPTGHRVHHGVEMWAKSIQEDSKGRINVKIFPAEQLGKAVDHYDMIASGTVSAAWWVPGYTPGRFPVIEAGELPFMVSDAPVGAKIIHQWYAEIAKTEMKEIKFCAIATHDPGRLHTKEAINSVADMKGVRIRPASAVVGNYLASLGAIPVKLAAPEAREAVERGVVDGVTFPWHTIINFGLAGSLTHHLDIPLYVPMAIYGINKKFYNGLSEEDKAVIDSHCTPEWSEKLSADWADWEKEGRPLLEKMPGHVFVKPTGDALKPWLAAAQASYDAWKQQVKQKVPGADPDALLDDLKTRLKDAGAGL